MSREELLRELISYRLPIEKTLENLSYYGWDCEFPLVTLTKSDVVSIMQRYLSGGITEQQLTDWADLVECREDIEYPTQDENLIASIIFRLANPNLNEEITSPLVESILVKELK